MNGAPVTVLVTISLIEDDDIDLIEDDGDDVDEIEEYYQRKEQRAISRVAPTRAHDELGLS